MKSLPLLFMVTIFSIFPSAVHSTLPDSTPLTADFPLYQNVYEVTTAQSDFLFASLTTALASSFTNVWVLHRSASDSVEYQFTLNAAQNRVQTPSITFTAGDQIQLQYRGPLRLIVLVGISFGTISKSWPTLALPSILYQQFQGVQLLVKNSGCKFTTSFSFTFGGSTLPSNEITLFEINYALQEAKSYHSQAELVENYVGRRAAVLQKLEGATEITYSPGFNSAIIGYKHSSLILQPNQKLYTSANAVISITDTEYSNSAAATLCDCPNSQISFLTSAGACQIVACPESADPIPYEPSSAFGFCKCKIDQVWNPVSQQCEYLCLGSITSQASFESCTGTAPPVTQDWCKADLLATGMLLNKGICQCLPHASWNNATAQCDPHCYMDAFSTGLRSGDKSCKCKNFFHWDTQKSRCALECSEVPLSTGQPRGDFICECRYLTAWNYSTFNCERTCKGVSYSTGVVNSDGGCICKESYVWSNDRLACINDCEADALSTGAFNGTACVCLATAMWDSNTRACIAIDCTIIPFSLQTPTGETDHCDCIDRFVWNNVLKICEIDCAQAGTLNNGTQLSVNECGCPSGTFWSYNVYECWRNCTIYDYTTKVNVNAEECICQDGYYWETTPNLHCQIDCGLRPGELTTFNPDDYFCNCDEDSYYFSYQLQMCAIDCTKKPHTKQTMYPTPYTCECILGYTWNADLQPTGNCSINCNGPFDLGKLTDSSCNCEPNAFFDSYSNACTVNCRNDVLSTKAFIGNACACKTNAIWNADTNKCQCKSGYVYNSSTKVCNVSGSTGSAAAGVIAGVVSTSVALLFAKLGYDTKLKAMVKSMWGNKEEEKGEKNDGSIESDVNMKNVTSCE